MIAIRRWRLNRHYKKRVKPFLASGYESFWERRYNEQHRTLHSCEDALKEARERAERAEAAARSFAEALREIEGHPWRSWHRITATRALNDHPSFSGEEA